LHIPNSLIPVLERVKTEQEQNKRDLGNYYKDGNYVFCWEDGRPYNPNYVNDMFQKFLIKHKFPIIRFHDLRHTFGSIAVLNAPLREVSKAMGHSREDFTDKVYIKELEKTKSVAINAVDSILKEV
jgi:integrase